MDETPAPLTPTVEPVSQSTQGSSGFWLLGGALMTLAISLAAAHAPPRVRLIGLFSVAFGLIVGWLLARLVATLDCHPSRRAIGLAAAVFTLIGLIGSAWETSRLFEAQKPKSGTDAIAARLIEQMKMQSSSGDPVGNAAIPLSDNASPPAAFRRYLSRRLQPLGDWRSPWPEAFWFLELCAAATASAWISTRRRPISA